MKQFIKDLKKDGEVNSYFAVIDKAEVRSYKDNSKFYFSVKVSDRTGNVFVKYWGGSNDEEVKAIHSSFEAQDAISIKGIVGEYKGSLEIAINPDSGGELSKITDFDRADLVESSEEDVEKMKSDLKDIILKIEDPDIKRLLESFFANEEFMKKFSLAPAARGRHHSYENGLIEHVLSLIKICERVAEIHTKLNRDLLIAGCIFHDMGKISEYEFTNAISMSREGEFLGHISIGYHMVAQKIESLENFPDLLKEKILHLILSHHGEVELGWGSTTDPKIPEAIALHHIDQVDAKIKGSFQEIKNAITDDEWIWTKDRGRLYRK